MSSMFLNFTSWYIVGQFDAFSTHMSNYSLPYLQKPIKLSTIVEASSPLLWLVFVLIAMDQLISLRQSYLLCGFTLPLSAHCFLYSPFNHILNILFCLYFNLAYKWTKVKVRFCQDWISILIIVCFWRCLWNASAHYTIQPYMWSRPNPAVEHVYEEMYGPLVPKRVKGIPKWKSCK
mgnify:CR=1 FL=1